MRLAQRRSQYLYFGTSKASKLRQLGRALHAATRVVSVSIRACVLVMQVNLSGSWDAPAAQHASRTYVEP
jgi:hypothetical protein